MTKTVPPLPLYIGLSMAGKSIGGIDPPIQNLSPPIFVVEWKSVVKKFIRKTQCKLNPLFYSN